MRRDALEHPNEMDCDGLANSEFNLVQNVDGENLEDVKAKLSQGQRKGILGVLIRRVFERSSNSHPYLSGNQGFTLE